MYCSSSPTADHTNCPSSVECFHIPLTNAQGALAAAVARGNPYGPASAAYNFQAQA